jgi:hypothetical protein
VRHDRIDSSGVVTPHRTAGSTTSAWDEPTPEPTSSSWSSTLRVRVVNAITGELLRELTIDATRDYQLQNSNKPPNLWVRGFRKMG